MKVVKRYSKVLFISTGLPIFVFMLTYLLLQKASVDAFCGKLGVEKSRVLEFNTELHLYVDSYNEMVDNYNTELSKEPDKVRNIEAIDNKNDIISANGYWLIVCNEECEILTNTTDVNEDIKNLVYKYTKDSDECGGMAIFECDRYFMSDIVVEDAGEKYTVWCILDIEAAARRMDYRRLSLLTVSFLVAFWVCIAILMWFLKNIFEPINMLKEATEQIRQGNFDITLDYHENNDIGELCHNFDDMRKQLKDNEEEAKEREKASREMISNISHDLKTPLTSIKGYVEGLMDNIIADNPEKKQKYLTTIYNKTKDMDKLIDELSLYSKIGSDNVSYNFKEIDAKEYFNDIAGILAVELDAKGIGFEVDNRLNDDVCIVADTLYLRRVINNIISNSVKNMPPSNGRIGIKLVDEGKYIRVDMSDNGRGISTKDLPHIFDRFYRGDASRNTAHGGSGIGLSIVKKVIEEHGGKIWVSSKEGEGTTMSFVLKKANERM